MQAKQIRVFTATEFYDAVIANPQKVLSVEKKKEEKNYKGTRFLNAIFNIGGDKKEFWMSLDHEIELTTGVSDPEDENDLRNQWEGTHNQIQTTVSKSGKFGQALLILNPEWVKIATEYITTGKTVSELLQSKLSDTNKKTPGAEIEDPIIRFKIDFTTYPVAYKHKFLRGKPRTIIYDGRTKYIDEAGKEQYKLAMVLNQNKELELVNTKNMHLFITSGSIVHPGSRFTAPSVPISKSYVSLPITCSRLIITPGPDEGFSDEVISADLSKLRLTLSSATTPPADGNPATSEKNPNEMSVEDCAQLLEDI